MEFYFLCCFKKIIKLNSVMSLTIILLLVGVALLVMLLLWTLGIYNKLVTLRNRYKTAWAQIDVQLKRRYDLIPNLVETAKSYMKHERETLERVIAARNSAFAAGQQVAQNPGNPAAMHQLQGAEGTLAGVLGRFMALAESYPDLKANTTMMQLSEELSSTENKIAFARQAFNDAIMVYNTAVQVIPNNIIASFTGFQTAELFEVTDTAQREAPRVSFA